MCKYFIDPRDDRTERYIHDDGHEEISEPSAAAAVLLPGAQGPEDSREARPGPRLQGEERTLPLPGPPLPLRLPNTPVDVAVPCEYR